MTFTSNRDTEKKFGDEKRKDRQERKIREYTHTACISV